MIRAAGSRFGYRPPRGTTSRRPTTDPRLTPRRGPGLGRGLRRGPTIRWRTGPAAAASSIRSSSTPTGRGWRCSRRAPARPTQGKAGIPGADPRRRRRPADRRLGGPRGHAHGAGLSAPTAAPWRRPGRPGVGGSPRRRGRSCSWTPPTAGCSGRSRPESRPALDQLRYRPDGAGHRGLCGPRDQFAPAATSWSWTRPTAGNSSGSATSAPHS